MSAVTSDKINKLALNYATVDSAIGLHPKLATDPASLLTGLERWKRSPVHNYIVPGLTSWLIFGPNPDGGCLRMFAMDREQQELITPHSHRFDFHCLVLAGKVVNRIWKVATEGDLYTLAELTYDGSPGKYGLNRNQRTQHYTWQDTCYAAGQTYAMQAYEIHSIRFLRGARVLFFEGPPTTDKTYVLEPCVDGETVPTFETRPWMFRRPE